MKLPFACTLVTAYASLSERYCPDPVFVQGRGRSKEAGSSGGGAAAGAPVSEEQLHPSWAAKRKQTLSITAVAPAGKKIKFDEEGGEGYAAATSAAAAASGPVAGAKGQAAAASGAGKRGFAGGPGRKDGVGKVAGRGPAPGAVRPGGMKAGGRGAAGQAAGGGRGSGAPTSGKAAGAKVRGLWAARSDADAHIVLFSNVPLLAFNTRCLHGCRARARSRRQKRWTLSRCTPPGRHASAPRSWLLSSRCTSPSSPPARRWCLTTELATQACCVPCDKCTTPC